MEKIFFFQIRWGLYDQVGMHRRMCAYANKVVRQRAFGA